MRVSVEGSPVQRLIRQVRSLLAGQGRELRVAAVLDPFSYEGFSDVGGWHLREIDAKNPGRWLRRFRPELILIESAWSGRSGAWKQQVSQFGEPGRLKLALVAEYARAHAVPFIFWAKDDPPHFERFLPAARLADWVLTTADECVPAYRDALGHRRVATMAFAANPRTHNPILVRPRNQKTIYFAGSWYNEKYEVRAKEQRALLEGVLNSGYELRILDRNSDRNLRKYRFPREFLPFVQDGVPYREISKVYSETQFQVNVNTITDSRTMFSRRVFELLASQTSVITNKSRAADKFFPGLLFEANCAADVGHILSRAEDDLAAVKRLAHLGWREVMMKHTYAHRARQINELTGLSEKSAAVTPDQAVTIISVTNRPENERVIVENFLRQRHKDKKLLVVLHGAGERRVWSGDYLAQLDERVQIIHMPDSVSLGVCLNRAREALTTRYWAKFDDDDLYFENYLSDAMMAFSYGDVSVVGKATYYVRVAGQPGVYLRDLGGQNGLYSRVGGLIAGPTIVADESKVQGVKFPDIRRGSDTIFLRRVLKRRLRVISTDPFNFLMLRGSGEGHTWQISQAAFMKKTVQHISEDWHSAIEV